MKPERIDPDDLVIPEAPHVWLALGIVTLVMFACLVVRFGLL